MAENKVSAFVVKERVEGLEKLVNQALEIDGLKDMAKDVTKRVLDEALESGKSEIKEAAKSTVQEAKEFILAEKEVMSVDMDKRLESARSEFQKALVDHLNSVEDRITKAERLLKIAIVLSILSALWSGLAI
jgi:hypothetical protein